MKQKKRVSADTRFSKKTVSEWICDAAAHKKNLRSMLKSILSTRNTGSHRDPLHILRQGAPPFAGPKDNL